MTTDPTREPYTLTITGTYPPKATPAGQGKVTATATVHIQRVPLAEAPRAMTLTTYTEGKPSRTVLRTTGGRLYTAFTPSGAGVTPGSVELPARQFQTYVHAEDWQGHEDTAAQHRDHAAADAALLCIIGDYAWVEIGEPRYVVHHHHGSDDLDHGGLVFTVAMEDAEEYPITAFFRADEFDQAWQYALDLAVRAEDGAAIRYLHHNRKALEVIEVHRPEAVTLRSVVRPPADVVAAQREYAEALTALGFTDDPQVEARQWERASRARELVLAAGFDPIPSRARPTEGRDEMTASRGE